MAWDFDFDKITQGHILPGMIGSVISLRFAPGDSWGERVLNVVTGSLLVVYCTPALSEWLHIAQGTGVRDFLSFAVGLFGLSLAAAVTSGIRQLQVAEIISGWISRKG